MSSCNGETGYSSIDSNNGNSINNKIINNYSNSGNDIDGSMGTQHMPLL